jgi:VanZ family protein
MQEASSKRQDASGKTQAAGAPRAWPVIGRWSIVAVWMGVIFFFSAQPDETLNLGQTTLISKLAHVGEYAVLGGLIQWARGARRAWLAWLMAVAYAVTDEFHQSFVPGRTPRVTDVLIDAMGAALGIVLVWRVARLA